VVSSLGDWIGFVAIVAVAQRVGKGSPEASISLVLSARLVPGFFFSQFAGVLVARWDRKKTMVACDIGRGATLATLPFIHTVWGLVLASFVLEVFTLMWSPAKDASVPNLVPSDHLTTVNSLSLVAAYGTFPVASVVFAVLTKVADWLSQFSAFNFINVNNNETLAIYVDVATFFLSALIIFTLPLVNRRERRGGNGRRIDVSQTFREVKEGWRFIFINRRVRAVMIAIGTGLIGGGMMVPLGSVFANEVLGAGTPGYGLLLTALGIGVALGVITVSALQKKVPKTFVFSTSVVVAGGCLIAAASMSTLAPAWAFVLGVGVCAGSVYVLGFTILQESVEDEFRGRIFAALYTLVRFCLLLSFTIAPILAGVLDRISNRYLDREVYVGIHVALPGVRLALWLAGLIILGAGMLAVSSLRPERRQRKAPA